MGDPGGIGPEVVVRALADATVRAAGVYRIYGCEQALVKAASLAGLPPVWREGAGVELVPVEGGATEAKPTKAGGAASLRALDAAILAAKAPPGRPDAIDAIVTAPICKEAWALAGETRFPGHTEMLADRFGAKRVAMMFHAAAGGGYAAFNVVLATTHIPLSRVALELTEKRVYDAISLGAEGVRRLGVASPRVGVLGLNPHAGEHGVLGDDESRVITPAIDRAKTAGIDAQGPFPADTFFNRCTRGEFDLAVAMYHDQGLIPVKLLAWDRAVNITLGLPIVRTSPDHGTAFDIAGKSAADAGSMKAALLLAARMATRAGRREA